ncbi:hypothetical protein [Acidianus brierleyi]|uniref:Uncharacterized protein n=1 Tax=Acidianus brierleyi TaxID=41673 RepID=A0A2U9IC42_9CREN|nr:hypothetical protein [Acidianus brierleyi]AWR93577.1 hypothetical protein DFR85_02095 [Acidianus brierleyi]
MDKYYFALLGEAGAAGIAKAFYVRFKSEKLKESYIQEESHWKYFKKYRRSILEMPTYYTLFLVGIIISLFGFKITRKVIIRLETAAINFYIKNFSIQGDIEKILEDEKHHMEI